jgi:hypothetical protein
MPGSSKHALMRRQIGGMLSLTGCRFAKIEGMSELTGVRFAQIDTLLR